MNKEKVITYIKDVLAKNFIGDGIYSNREDSAQIYNALMSISVDTEYSRMSALLKLIKTQTGLNNKNLDDFIALLDKAASAEGEGVVEVPVKEEPVNDVTLETAAVDVSDPEIIIGNDEVIKSAEEVDDNSESAKGNVMVFVISLLVLIIIILAVIIVLFC